MTDKNSPYIGLRAILNNPELVLLFREHLKGHFSSENLAFIIEVENFKSMKSRGFGNDEIKKKAGDIFAKYFNTSSNYELNVPGSEVDILKQKMQGNDLSEVYNSIEEHILKLLELDCYPRFLESPLYKNYIESMSIEFLFRGAYLTDADPNKQDHKKLDDSVKQDLRRNPSLTRLHQELENKEKRSPTVTMLEEFFENKTN